MLDFLKISEKKENTPVEKAPKFEVALREVDELSLKAKAYQRIEPVAEHGKFLKFGAHKVTGKELNTVAAHIDDTVIQTRNVQIETLQHIIRLYETVESLDEDHIASVLAAMKAAETATGWARINEENIDKITNYLIQDDRFLAYKQEQEDRFIALENKLKTAYLVAGCSVAAAVTSLVLCLIGFI